MNLTFQSIPSILSKALVDEYVDIKKRYQVEDWGPSQLMGGRFAEVVMRVFQELLNTSHTPFGTDITGPEKQKIMNAVVSSAIIDEHVRQKVVPLAKLLLDFRNNRDSAHLGGFDANHMDSFFVMNCATWILCELIRVYGGYQMDEAQKIVEDLTVKEYPVIVEVEGSLFIARNDLTAKEEALIILYKVKKADFSLLFSSTRDGNKARFQTMLRKAVHSKLMGQKDGNYFLLPLGIKFVEEKSLLVFS